MIARYYRRKIKHMITLTVIFNGINENEIKKIFNLLEIGIKKYNKQKNIAMLFIYCKSNGRTHASTYLLMFYLKVHSLAG